MSPSVPLVWPLLSLIIGFGFWPGHVTLEIAAGNFEYCSPGNIKLCVSTKDEVISAAATRGVTTSPSLSVNFTLPINRNLHQVKNALNIDRGVKVALNCPPGFNPHAATQRSVFDQ